MMLEFAISTVGRGQASVTEAGAHTTTDTKTAMFDHPTVDKRVVNEAFDEEGTAQVVVQFIDKFPNWSVYPTR
jgi:hypothetical protein